MNAKFWRSVPTSGTSEDFFPSIHCMWESGRRLARHRGRRGHFSCRYGSRMFLNIPDFVRPLSPCTRHCCSRVHSTVVLPTRRACVSLMPSFMSVDTREILRQGMTELCSIKTENQTYIPVDRESPSPCCLFERSVSRFPHSSSLGLLIC